MIFDETYGSLRLTERLYLEFKHVLERLFTAIDAESDVIDFNPSYVELILDELSTFTEEETLPDIDITNDPPTGYERVFTQGSKVCRQQTGLLTVDVEIIQPTLMEGKLMYQVKFPQRHGKPPTLQWIAASALEPSGEADAWDYAWWNRETETYEDLPEDEEL